MENENIKQCDCHPHPPTPFKGENSDCCKVCGKKIKQIKPKNEGWCDDISSHGKRHYFKDGISLCGREKEKHFFRYFDKESLGYAFAEDCKLCIKKKKELVDNENSKKTSHEKD